jgi:polyhydroxybutyrate depolymerase
VSSRSLLALCCCIWIPAYAATTIGDRTYEIHLPNGQSPKDPAALVIVLHGGGGNAANAERMSGMSAKSDREGFVAVYPNGTAGRPGGQLLTWNAWRCCGPALDRNVDDVAFIRSVVDDVAKRYPIDRKRIYAAGLSNGGMMSYRLGCEAGDLFAAIAPVAGALNSYDCTTGPKVSVIAFHGTADKHVLFDGGHPQTSFDSHNRADNSVAFAMQTWRKRNACEGTDPGEKKGSIIHHAWKCAGGTAVELYAVEGGGHAWPGGQKGIRFGNVDTPTTEISATDLMWDFFAKHPKQ